MKKFVLLILTILILANFGFYSIPNPKSNNIGAIVGKIYQEFDKDWISYGGTMAKGKYYIGEIILVNTGSKREYTALTNLNGYYYFMNMEPGEYSIKGNKKIKALKYFVLP